MTNLLKVFNPIGKFFNLICEALVEARKARAEAITKRIGR
jgi:hypothetical protein